MGSYLLDTNVASALLDGLHREHVRAKSFLGGLGSSELIIPCITCGEIQYGYKVHKGVDLARKQAIETELAEFAIFDVTKHTVQPYSDLRARLFDLYGGRKGGKVRAKSPEDLCDGTPSKKLGIQENDLWIVAIALEHNFDVVTSDKKMNRIVDAALELRPKMAFWDWLTGQRQTRSP